MRGGCLTFFAAVPGSKQPVAVQVAAISQMLAVCDEVGLVIVNQVEGTSPSLLPSQAPNNQ